LTSKAEIIEAKRGHTYKYHGKRASVYFILLLFFEVKLSIRVISAPVAVVEIKVFGI
jgi:hypothetical protein